MIKFSVVFEWWDIFVIIISLELIALTFIYVDLPLCFVLEIFTLQANDILMNLAHFFDLLRGFHDFFDLLIWWAWIITLCFLFHHSSCRVHCFIIYFFCKLCRGLLITFFTFFITLILIKLLINDGNRFYILKFIFKIQIYFNHGRFKWILRFNFDLIVD